MPCRVDYEEPKRSTIEEKLRYFLCQACRLIEKEEMDKIVFGEQPWNEALKTWYARHLLQDYRYNKYIEKDNDAGFAEKELNRIGYKVIKVDNRYEVTQSDNKHDN
jgi:hypothetical protein